MNKLNYTKYFFIIIGYLISSNISAQTNRVLIVTIANYPKNSGWENIHADNDKVYILEMLSILKSASNLNGNLNCSKELEHYAS